MKNRLFNMTANKDVETLNTLLKTIQSVAQTSDGESGSSSKVTDDEFDYSNMTPQEKEAHLSTFYKSHNDVLSFRQYVEEYSKCYDCKAMVIPRRKEDSGFFSFMSTSHQTLTDIDSVNFVSDMRDIEEENKGRETPYNLHVFLNTNGGRLATAEVICKTLLRYKGIVEIFVDNYAMSAGTMIALCGNTLHLRSNAYLGQIDPQMGTGWFLIPANSIIENNYENFETPWIRDLVKMASGPANGASDRVHNIVDRIATHRKWTADFKERIIKNLLMCNTDTKSTNAFSHDKPYDFDDLSEFWHQSNEQNPVLYEDWPESAKLIRMVPEIKPDANPNPIMSMMGM